MSEETQQIKDRINPILQDAHIRRAGIFGSFARGEQRPDSDVDLLVEYPETYSLFDIVALRNSLEHALQRKVDLVGYNSIKPRLKESVLAHHVPVL